MEDYFIDFDWTEWEENFDRINSTHSLLSLTKNTVLLKEFLQDYIWVYPDIATFPGFENTLIELPVLVFINYNNAKRQVINLLELNAFEMIKYVDYLFVEEKEAGIYVLRGNLPEDFKGDRGTRESLKVLAEATERRRIERRTTGWIPTTEVGR